MKPLYNRIVGAGAGSAFWLWVALCRELEDLVLSKQITIEVYDPDNFVGGNGSKRLPKPHNPNQPKVEYLATFIKHVMRDTPPITHAEKLLPSHFLEGDWSKTIVVDGTDMGRLQREMFWSQLEQHGIKGIRLALDGTGIATISPGPPIYMGDESEQHDAYTKTPHLGQVFRSVGMGAEAILYLLYTGKVIETQHFMPTLENAENEFLMPTIMEDIMDRNDGLFRKLAEGGGND